MSDESPQRPQADRPPRETGQNPVARFLKRIRQMFGGQ